MINEELRAPSEEILQGCGAFIGIKAVFLVNPYPGQLLPPLSESCCVPPGAVFGAVPSPPVQPVSKSVAPS